MENETVMPVVFCYKYIWKTTDDKMCVKFVTGTLAEHENFKKALCESKEIESALCEYVHEIDFAFLNKVDSIKTKEEK